MEHVSTFAEGTSVQSSQTGSPFCAVNLPYDNLLSGGSIVSLWLRSSPAQSSRRRVSQAPRCIPTVAQHLKAVGHDCDSI